MGVKVLMKILVIIDISLIWFYGYIEKISIDILKKNFDKQKIDQNSWKCKKKPRNNVIKNIINNLRLFCWRIWYIYNMICDIRCNYFISADKKCEFCNYTLIIKFHERLI